jgi:hypothetical protein
MFFGGINEFLFIGSGIVTLLTVILGLSIPPALKAKSWKRFFSSATLVILGIVIPLIMFILSGFVVPEWKGGCRFGWLDCFAIGKYAVTPLVIWGCAGFYVVQVLRPDPPYRTWVTLGMLHGAATSGACFVIGCMSNTWLEEVGYPWLIIPGYVAVWYGILAAHAYKLSVVTRRQYVIAFLTSLPWWIGSVALSMLQFSSLRDNPSSGCFVVTAAMKGHDSITGPIFDIPEHNGTRKANQQLMTFWQLESIWRERSPLTHTAFRRLYNRIGPHIAQHIGRRWMADIVYMALKPLEWTAAYLLRTQERS